MVVDVNWTSGDYSTIYINIKSLHCTPETNVMLHVNYTPLKNKRKSKNISTQMKMETQHTQTNRMIQN